jgi:hypothetical protein
MNRRIRRPHLTLRPPGSSVGFQGTASDIRKKKSGQPHRFDPPKTRDASPAGRTQGMTIGLDLAKTVFHSAGSRR